MEMDSLKRSSGYGQGAGAGRTSSWANSRVTAFALRTKARPSGWMANRWRAAAGRRAAGLTPPWARGRADRGELFGLCEKGGGRRAEERGGSGRGPGKNGKDGLLSAGRKRGSEFVFGGE